MKRKFVGVVEAGEPLIRQALKAIWNAQAVEATGLAMHEIERLQLLADSLYQAVINVQLVNAGQPSSII
ncbi:hypothetical protein NJF44_21370 [Pseudomonas guariconensis]|uniref:hypothetical protein n=1 Tax=Pseudomonas TaxID=286 RepID=UPI001CE45CE2|nr:MULTISPECIES: hypothetical protein [Pseudomonas]MCO7514766.1 hypothetical protein [Pseudomonas putida]MCO7607790.1 hypothetical protein [Pseudomonas guariconensis]MCO7630870.1 hypothetical protein [Pseudomonas guariconensis]